MASNGWVVNNQVVRGATPASFTHTHTHTRASAPPETSEVLSEAKRVTKTGIDVRE